MPHLSDEYRLEWLMIALQRILVPTDFGDTAALALQYAQSLAGVFDATLHVLHVLEDPLPGWKPPGHVVAVPKICAGMEQDAQEQISRLLSDGDRQRFHAQLVTIWGKPFVEIIRYAKNMQIDLIVMGTHGRGPLSHMVMGSVAERVVRGAPCPVLTVGNSGH
jgi:nucleotide-binding universal stress UspA family protein